MAETNGPPATTGVAPRDSAAFEVREALGRPGCAICELVLRAVRRFIQSIAYEQVNDLALRAQLRGARGFCNTHAFQWLHEARSALGTALIYRDVLQATLADLERAPRRDHGTRLRNWITPSTPTRGAHAGCPVCRIQREAEARYVEVLVLSLIDPGLADVFDRSAGLCRPHTLAAAQRGGPGARRVLERARSAIEQLVAELDEVVRKEDYRFRHEPRTESERTAPGRAIVWAAGREGLVTEAQ